MNSASIAKCPHCGEPLKQDEFVTFVGGVREVWKGAWTCHCQKAEEERILNQAQEAARLEAEQAKAIDDKCLRCGIPLRFLHSDAGAEYAQDVLTGLYIVGKTGVGKTHLAAGIARRCIMTGKVVRFTSLLGILNKAKSSFGKGGKVTDVIEYYRSCDVLVLDDLGQEYVTPWMLEVLYHIVNSCYENNKRVVITSQYERDALAGRLAKQGDKEKAAAIVSRLSEMCKRVALSGEDRRLKHA